MRVSASARTKRPAASTPVSEVEGNLAVALIVDDVDQPSLECRSALRIQWAVNEDDDLPQGATEHQLGVAPERGACVLLGQPPDPLTKTPVGRRRIASISRGATFTAGAVVVPRGPAPDFVHSEQSGECPRR